jgi:S-adenosylmethionine decarboxylase
LKTLGRHVIAEFYDCRPELLADPDYVRAVMLQTARVIGATIVAESFHTFSPQGVSGTVIIAESHLSIHTWPENGYAAVDVYTCGGLNPRVGCEFLSEQLDASSSRLQEILRGLPDDLDGREVFRPEEISIVSRTERVRMVANGGEVASL